MCPAVQQDSVVKFLEVLEMGAITELEELKPTNRLALFKHVFHDVLVAAFLCVKFDHSIYGYVLVQNQGPGLEEDLGKTSYLQLIASLNYYIKFDDLSWKEMCLYLQISYDFSSIVLQ